MAETERATEDMSKNWEDRVAESKKDVKVCLPSHHGGFISNLEVLAVSLRTGPGCSKPD